MQTQPRKIVLWSVDRLVFWAATTIALVIVVAVYQSSLSYAYVYDDHALFFSDQRLRNGWESVRNIAMPVMTGSTYFRPAVLLSFVAEFSIFDGFSRASRSINLLIHLGNCVFVALLVRRCATMSDNGSVISMPTYAVNILAALASLLYGLHPSLIESAGWVSGRFDLMVTFFSLSALLLAIRTDREPKYWAVAVCTFAALMSKEMAITLPVVILLFRSVAMHIDMRNLRELFRTNKKLAVALFVSVALYIAIRLVVHPGLIHVDEAIVSGVAQPLGFLTLVGSTLLFYLRVIVYPYRDTNPMHPFELTDAVASTSEVGASFVVLLAALAFPLIGWRFRWSSLWLWCAMLVSLAPVLNILPLRLEGSIGENRFLTFPLAIAVCALAYSFAAIYRVLESRRKLLLLCALITTPFVVAANAAFVHATLPIWRSDATLFASCFTQYPRNVRAAESYLQSTMLTADRSTALRRIEMQYAGVEVPAALLTPLAAALAMEGRRGDATKYFEKALLIRTTDGSDNMETVSRYAEALQTWGEAKRAEPMIERAKAIRRSRAAPSNSFLIAHLEMRQAVLLNDQKRFTSGLALMTAAVPAEMQVSSRMAISTFRSNFCRDVLASHLAGVCNDEVWQQKFQ